MLTVPNSQNFEDKYIFYSWRDPPFKIGGVGLRVSYFKGVLEGLTEHDIICGSTTTITVWNSG